MTKDLTDLLAFCRGLEDERPDAVLNAVIRLAEETIEGMATLEGAGLDPQGSRVALESYVNVLLLFAVQHPGRHGFQESWRRGWMDRVLT